MPTLLQSLYKGYIDSSSTIHNAVYLTLKEAILTNQFSGELSENQVSNELKVSRTPVREAMNKLSSDGIIEVSQGRRAKVKSITHEELQDICVLLRCLYEASMELCLKNITDEEIGTLEEVVELINFYVKRGDIGKVAHYNTLFHLRVCQYSRNNWLLQTVEKLSIYIDNHRLKTLQDPKRLDASYEDHLALLNVIKSRDIGTAHSIIIHHVRSEADMPEQHGK